MMPPTTREGSKLIRGLDRAAAEVNPFLTVIAIGLGAATLTSFAALAIKDALPPITRFSCSESTTAPSAAPSSQTTAARRQATVGDLDHMISNRPMRNQ
jgi:hypothetical protein